MRPDVDLNHLPLFVTVAETGSMTDTARRLGLPKSSVSRGVAGLEAALGVQLFHRTTRKVTLTTAGAAFLERARRALALVREATETLPEQEAEPSGVLRLTAPVDLGLTLLGDVVAQFHARYPGVRLDVRLSNREEDLVAEGFDLALRIARRLKDSTLVARRLGALEFRLYAAPAYLARHGTPRELPELARHAWLAMRGFDVVPEAPAPALVTDDMTFLLQATRAGVGVAALPTFLAQPDCSTGRLVRVLPKWTATAGALWLVHPKTAHPPRKVTAFRDFLVEYLATRPLGPA